MRIAVIGASTDIGRRVVRLLCDRGHAVIATSRDKTRLTELDRRAGTAAFDIVDPMSSATFLDSVDRIVSVAHASTVPALVARVPACCRRLVVIGSTMRDSAVPDRRADAVRRGETAFLASGHAGTMLHPTMIYGSRNESNVIRVLRLVDRWPRWLPLVLPVPGGGRSMVQPVYVGDVAAALAAAIIVEPAADPVVVVAGAEKLSLADMLRTCARFRGRRLLIVPLPTELLIAVAWTLRAMTGLSPYSVGELRRSRENKAYDITPLRQQLAVAPLSFAEGLKRSCSDRESDIEANLPRE